MKSYCFDEQILSWKNHLGKLAVTGWFTTRQRKLNPKLFGFLECLKSDNVLFKKHRGLLGMNKGTIYNCQSCSFPAASRSCQLFYTPFEIDKMFFCTTKIWFKLKCCKMFCKTLGERRLQMYTKINTQNYHQARSCSKGVWNNYNMRLSTATCLAMRIGTCLIKA